MCRGYLLKINVLLSWYSLMDFLETFPLYRGKGSGEEPDDQVGCVKGAIRLYPTVSHDPYGTVLSEASTESVNILVRVYVVEVSDQQLKKRRLQR